MAHSADTNKLLEIFDSELWMIVQDDPWSDISKLLARPLHDRLDIGLDCMFADLPVVDELAVIIQQAAKGEKSPGQIDVRDFYVPELVKAQRVLEALGLLEGFEVVLLHQPDIPKNALDARGLTATTLVLSIMNASRR